MKKTPLLSKRVIFTLVTVFIFTLSACKTEPKTPKKTQMQEVMDVHDAVMPKMGSIGRLVKELGIKRDSLKMIKVQLEGSHETELVLMTQGIDSLQNAYKQMMDWMKDFGSQFTAEEILKGKALTKDKKAALFLEAKKVGAMEASVNGSILNAEELLSSIKKPTQLHNGQE